MRCNKATDLDIAGTVVQTREGQRVRGEYFEEVTCTPGAPVAWTATATPSGDGTFRKGNARATGQASGIDTDYGTLATGNDASAVSLTTPKT